jgi:hypothetical protein
MFITGNLPAQMTVSGVLDSTFSVNVFPQARPAYSLGAEEFANIRFQSRIRDKALVYGAINLFAAAGDYAVNAASLTAYVGGENYLAGIELERLYFRLYWEYVNFDAGLMRLPFGYGQVWGPTDFLNPRNPLKPDARPRGILGASLSGFPTDDLKLLLFYAAPRNVFSRDGDGSRFGFSLENHWEKASVQGLYFYELPKYNAAYGIHRAGFSLKADIEIGLVIEALYTYNHEAKTKIDGLSASIGMDYSFFDGDFIVLAEYLYNGESSSTAYDTGENILGMPNRHNLYTGFTWRFNYFTNASLALVSTYDSISFTPVVTVNHDLSQGITMTVLAQVPVIHDELTSEWHSSLTCTVRLRIRF